MSKMEFVNDTEYFQTQIPLSPSEKARSWLSDPNLVYLETRSTGIGEFCEIIEIAICDNQGKPLLKSLVNTLLPVSENIIKNYGINRSELESAPHWKTLLKEIQSLLKNRLVIVYNSRLDGRLIKQTCKAMTGRAPQWIDEVNFCCLMKLAEEQFESNNEYRVITLKQACFDANIEYTPSKNILKEIKTVKALLEKLAEFD